MSNERKRAEPGKYKGILFVRNLPTETKTLFKALCVRRKVTMETMIERLIWQAVYDDMQGRQYK